MPDSERSAPDVAEFRRAVTEGDRARVEHALAARPELAGCRDENGVSVVCLAVYAGHDDVARLLARRRTALDVFEASALGDAAAVTALAERDPSLANAYSPDGFHPLGYACFFGRTDVAEALLARGADVEAPARNPMRVRPLHSAVAHAQPDVALRLARMLLEAGASPNAVQERGFTPLHEAALRGHEELVHVLVDRGADVAARNAAGETAADLARSRGHAAIANLLEREIERAIGRR